MSSDDQWSAEAITAKIREIAIATFGLDIPDSTSPIRDAGFDSMALIDIVMSLEDAFACQLPLEQLPQNPTTNDFVALVQASLAKK